MRAEGQMHKTRRTWRTERGEGKCNRVGLSIETLSVSVVDKGASREALASTTQNTGSFCFPPR